MGKRPEKHQDFFAFPPINADPGGSMVGNATARRPDYTVTQGHVEHLAGQHSEDIDTGRNTQNFQHHRKKA